MKSRIATEIVIDALPADVWKVLMDFSWEGKLIHPLLLTGRHGFTVQAAPAGGTRLIHDEDFTGLLVPVLGRMVAATRESFREMDLALKHQVEAG